ncbi:hypothetical protein K5X82_07805 [Halosquirtibacter xylanolyticus]|uniref:hypothetical protein n=1 Tax=Halosquirtibacter xylanolyticus TaxID=3374599 RepID=UPI0037497725|nr:hypothetical protein K5X82_07805 [Prolixibacteraceae bacterium]
MNIDLLLLVFFILGFLSCLGIIQILKFKSKYQFKLPALLLIFGGLSLLVFAIAWAVSSLIEYENQAAGVGMLIFGGSALICFSIATKFMTKKRVGVTDAQRVK